MIILFGRMTDVIVSMFRRQGVSITMGGGGSTLGVRELRRSLGSGKLDGIVLSRIEELTGLVGVTTGGILLRLPSAIVGCGGRSEMRWGLLGGRWMRGLIGLRALMILWGGRDRRRFEGMVVERL